MTDIFELFKLIAKPQSEKASAPSHMIVGLGNPGREYEMNRHNAGFRALDSLLAKEKTELTREKFRALFGTVNAGGYPCVFLKPLTYMNSSGEAVKQAADFYKIEPEHILVLVDDIYLEPGRMRFRPNGSAGGHNGLESIIDCLSSDRFPRIRFGVGQKPTPEYSLADWVLADLPPCDEEKLRSCFSLLPEAVKLIFDEKTDLAMSLCNGHRAPEKQETVRKENE